MPSGSVGSIDTDKKRESPSSHVNPIRVSSTAEDEKTNRTLKDVLHVELLAIKEDVKGIYGEGTFNSSIGKKNFEALGFYVNGTEERAFDMKEIEKTNEDQVMETTSDTQTNPVVALIAPKNFKEALLGAMERFKKKMKE